MAPILSKIPEPIYQTESPPPVVASKAQTEALRAVFEAGASSLLAALQAHFKSYGVNNAGEARELALELLSELFIEAMKAAHNFDVNQSARLWLLGIGRNLIKRKLRKRAINYQREQLVGDMAISEGEAQGDSEIFDRVAVMTQPMSVPIENREAVREMLDRLSDEDRKVIDLAILHEMNGEQLALALNINPAAARQRLSRALRRLKVVYGQLNKMEGHYE